MSAYKGSFEREKAVRLSAELLQWTGAAFFPLNVHALLSCFSRQVRLIPYRALEKIGEEKQSARPDPALLSRDGFCTRVRGVLMDYGCGPKEESNWNIYYNDSLQDARVRFTLMHELGHILLGHHQLLGEDTLAGKKQDPEYVAADAQADQFSINMLAPAPAVFRLLSAHGFACQGKQDREWRITDRGAPTLRDLGKDPDPETLVRIAFGLSQTAAHRRLYELPDELAVWKDIGRELYRCAENIPHRSGWYCWVCNTRRRTASLYCPGCGKSMDYVYQDRGRFPRTVIGLRAGGRFDFCCVCGNTEFDGEANYCPVCGAPVVNQCENALHTDGDFVRSGMQVIRGTHFCRPTDIYCGTCGLPTAFGAQHGPRKNYWLPNRESERCRSVSTRYAEPFRTLEGKLIACPSCGSTKTVRGGRYCAECWQPLENDCAAERGRAHACSPNDRYCSVCGNPTLFMKAGMLPAYDQTAEYAALKEAERREKVSKTADLLIREDGTMFRSNQEAH